MISFFRPSLICCLVATLTPLVHGQMPAPSPAAASPDDGWQQLRQLEWPSAAVTQNNKLAVSATGTSLATVGAPTPATSVATDYLSRADQLEAFRTAHAGDPRLGEARRIEALLLVYAGYYGDSSQQLRRANLVAQVRADSSVPEAARFSLAMLADFLPLRFQPFKSEPIRLAQFEQTVRALVAEFPDLPQAYQSLLSLAKDCPDSQATQIASDLLSMPAPTDVKTGAQLILDRHALVGQSLPALLSAGLAGNNVPTLANNHLTILYAWVSWNEGTLLEAQEIAAKAPAGATILGVNLDTDTAAARKVASSRGLPGLQLYDPAGPAARLPSQLKLTADNLVYTANWQGILTAVTARVDLAVEIAAANK